MKSLNEAMKNLQKSKIIKENNLKSKKSLKTESKFDKVQATLPLDNFHSMGIIVSDDGETVQYMYSNDENSIYESEIEYDEEGNPYFKDKNDNTWYLNEFMRTDYPKTVKEMKQDAKTKSNDNAIVIKTGLSDEKAQDILDSVIGQMSDGIWENSSRMNRYWKYADIIKEGSEIAIKISYPNSYENGFKGKSENEIKKFFAQKIKQIVKEEELNWDKNNEERSCYLDRHSGVTVKDAYRVYDKLLGRRERITEANQDEYNYMLLDRLKQDCEYYLGNGNRAEKHLWAGNVDGQIAKMKELYNKLPKKPEWLSMKDIENYEKEMKQENKIEERFSKSNDGHDIYCDVCGDCIYEEGPESDHFLNGEEYLGGHVCFNCIKNNDGYNKMKEIMKQNTKADLNESLEMNEDIKTKILDYLNEYNIENLMDYGSDEDAIGGMNSISEMFKDILDILKIKYVNVSTVDGISDGKYVTTIDFGDKTLDLDIRASEEKDDILEDVKTIIDFCNNKNENLTEDVGTMTPDEYILRETKKALLDRGLDIDLLHETCSEFGLAEYLRTTIHYILNGINFNVNEYVYGEDFDVTLDNKLNLSIDMFEDLDEDKEINKSTITITPAERKILNAVKVVSSKYDLSNIKIETTRKGNTHIMSTKGEDIVTIGPLTDDEKEDLRLNGYYINN